MRSLLLSAAAAVSVLAYAAAAQATPFSFTATQGSGNNLLDASASITPGSGVLDVSLNNNVVNPRSAGQEVSDIEITFAAAPTSASLLSQSGSLISIDTSTGVATPVAGNPTRWGASLSGSTITLTALTGGQPENMIIGPADTEGLYSNANSSIGNFNPHITGTGTFVIAAPGVTGDSIIKSVVFSFGTDPDTFVPGVPVTPPSVPEPMSLLLLGSGLLGLGAFRSLRS